MEKTLVIKKSDLETITNILERLTPESNTIHIQKLKVELGKADIVDDEVIDNSVIQLQSTFMMKEKSSSLQVSYQLVLPKEADLKEKKISILSPLGVAVIGYRVGSEINWVFPGGEKQITILEVKQAARVNKDWS
ncbi:nucleoside diphosphate kinase regulator [Wandonia haliotis]|uniref:Nucleoside diphosphate kinase regulator n=1 Tax=Wandonia haliotis TaxID=574963 RepID=A0ABN1MTA6_9FLAO